MAKNHYQDAVSSEIKSKFNLDNFKDKKGLSNNTKYKEQRWVPFSPALQELSIGLDSLMGHILM